MKATDSGKSCPRCGTPVPADAPRGLCPACVLAGAAAVPGGSPTQPGPAPTATAEIPSLARVAAAFPQLEVHELIGRGGMGFVFKARQPHLDRFVALKLLPDQLAADPQFAERFHREARVLAKLQHPNIVTVFDFGRTTDFYFLLMEFVDGVNLRQAMQAGRFSPAEALAIVPRICEALQYAHDLGVTHRDIKPENILLDARGRVKIADFGIAKLVGETAGAVTLTGSGAALGSVHYMAPEQWEKPASVDHRADIYSLGVVFYEMLTGELPIGRFAAPSARTPVDTRVDEVVMRTLEKDPVNRFQTAGEVGTQVEHLKAAGAAGAAPDPVAGSGAPPSSGGPGGPSREPAGDARSPRRISRLGLVGAVIAGVGIPLPVTVLFAVLAGQGGLSGGEMIAVFGGTSTMGIAGCILGWLSLNGIRESGGRLGGLPMALFAAFAWPLCALFILAVVIAVYPLRMVNGTVPSAMGALLIQAIPAGLITFGVWSVFAARRWANHEPLPVRHRRGVLKWIFLVLMLAAAGLVLMRLRQPVSPPRASVAGRTEVSAVLEFSSVQVRDADGDSWLDFVYTLDTSSGVQPAFSWDCSIPDYDLRTRLTRLARLPGDAPTVERWQLALRLPRSAGSGVANRWRDEADKALMAGALRVSPGDRRRLLELQDPGRGTISAWLGAQFPVTP